MEISSVNFIHLLDLTRITPEAPPAQPRTQALWFVYVIKRTWDGTRGRKMENSAGAPTSFPGSSLLLSLGTRLRERLVEFAFKMAGQCSAKVCKCSVLFILLLFVHCHYSLECTI
jgi:hypothetical protein